MKDNILIYNFNEPLPEQGGMERVTDVLASGLRKAGRNVYVLCSAKNRLNKQYIPLYPIYYLPTDNSTDYILDLVSELKIEVIIDQTEGGIVGPFGIFKYRPKRLSYAALLAVQHSSTRDVLRNAALIYGKKGDTFYRNIMAKIYNNTVLPIRYLHFLYHARRVNRNLDRNYDRTILLSPSFIKNFVHYYPKADKKKLLSIPNPNTYPDECETTIGEKRILFVGRLKNNPKGVDKLLRIWKMVQGVSDGWILDIVGDGEDRQDMEQYANELALKNVIFHGFKDPKNFYKRASVLCMTSLYEGFGMVLTEAMQHGVIPMAFNSYGAASDIIVDNQTGYLIQPFDEDKYAKNLSKLMTSDELRRRMSTNTLNHSKNFSQSYVINKWLELIDSL